MWVCVWLIPARWESAEHVWENTKHLEKGTDLLPEFKSEPMSEGLKSTGHVPGWIAYKKLTLNAEKPSSRDMIGIVFSWHYDDNDEEEKVEGGPQPNQSPGGDAPQDLPRSSPESRRPSMSTQRYKKNVGRPVTRKPRRLPIARPKRRRHVSTAAVSASISMWMTAKAGNSLIKKKH